MNTASLSRRATRKLASFLRERSLQHIMIYIPFRNELSPLYLIEFYPEAEYYLPRVNGDFLSVHPYISPREHHKIGFEQPGLGSIVVGEEVLEAVVVPGLAFDTEGYRLGYGGGYYDRFLAVLPPEVVTIGLVPEKLVLPRLPRDEWDEPVACLATERGVRPVNTNEN